ncbi:MAG TPA: hypothetical protein VKE22_11200 [Haliangiales bacterium]|nr:hypothetical protein [Haliangiales bacterium]
MRCVLVTLAVLTSTPLVAHADERGVDRDLLLAAQAIVRLSADLELPASMTVERCKQAIHDGRADGVPASFELTSSAGYNGLPSAYPDPGSSGESHLRFGDADAVCAKLAEWMVLGQARKAVEEAARALEWMKMIDKASNHEENGAKLIATAKACNAAIGTLAAAKMDTIKVARPGRSDHDKVPVAEIDGRYCAPLAKVAATFADEVRQARRAEWERLAAPYKAAGLTGDKLDLVVSLSGRAIYGRGGGELTTPREKKAASVMFEVLTANNGSVTLRRYQFSGDKLIKTTSADYPYRPSPAAYR